MPESLLCELIGDLPGGQAIAIRALEDFLQGIGYGIDVFANGLGVGSLALVTHVDNAASVDYKVWGIEHFRSNSAWS